jgi:hypothetical protein
MLTNPALPFVVRRQHQAIDGREVTSTSENTYGLVRLGYESLYIQWRVVREISRVGREIRSEREQDPVREVVVPLARLSGVRMKRDWSRFRPRHVLVLTAVDLTAFDAITDEDDVPGLALDHPAEIVLEVRRSDRNRLGEFTNALRAAVSEHLLKALDAENDSHLDGSMAHIRITEGENEASENEGTLSSASRPTT